MNRQSNRQTNVRMDTFFDRVHECDDAKANHEYLKRSVNKLFLQIVYEQRWEEFLNDLTSTMLDESNTIEKLLILAALNGNVAIVEKCLNNRAKDKFGDALLAASKMGNIDVVKLLLSRLVYPLSPLRDAVAYKKVTHLITMYIGRTYRMDQSSV